jgi:hypothetical protein
VGAITGLMHCSKQHAYSMALEAASTILGKRMIKVEPRPGSLSRNPITGVTGCCARAANGHVAAAPSRARECPTHRTGEELSRSAPRAVSHGECGLLVGFESELLGQHHVPKGKIPCRTETPEGDFAAIIGKFFDVHVPAGMNAIPFAAMRAPHLEGSVSR